MGEEVILGAEEGLVFANDDPWDFIEQYGTGAHRAGGKGGVDGAVPVNGRGETPGVFQGIHFPMEDGAAILDAAVAAPADDFPIMDEDATDGNAPLAEAGHRLVNRGLQKYVHGREYASRAVRVQRKEERSGGRII